MRISNSRIANFRSEILDFQIHKILNFFSLSYLDISKKFQFGKFKKFPTCEIRRIFNLKNSKKFQFGKLQKFPIWKVPRNCRFGKF